MAKLVVGPRTTADQKNPCNVAKTLLREELERRGLQEVRVDTFSNYRGNARRGDYDCFAAAVVESADIPMALPSEMCLGMWGRGCAHDLQWISDHWGILECRCGFNRVRVPVEFIDPPYGRQGDPFYEEMPENQVSS